MMLVKMKRIRHLIQIFFTRQVHQWRDLKIRLIFTSIAIHKETGRSAVTFQLATDDHSAKHCTVS
ncbi:hypothetical protein SADUNF_Sadunf05G0083000 [Salix dunnii]|uniref:Uncharacterized protein n=1 Tax=Salix dunnii TaxID=1413687 RepID=A0A835N224_9ROSI|nr:hypothetical protein SADUNF_Sadunf05G0083000 [Salix dunnii]